jgi:hypothetical protein
LELARGQRLGPLAHREKLTQLKAELEGMMVFGEPGSFVMERLKALHADISRELGD